MAVRTPGAFLPPMKPPRPGAQVLVVDSLSGIVRGGRVRSEPHHLSGGPCVLTDGFWYLLTAHTEGVLWARGWARTTRAALEAAFKLSGIVHV